MKLHLILTLFFIFCVFCLERLADEVEGVTDTSLIKRISTIKPKPHRPTKATHKPTTLKKFHSSTPKHKICHPFLPFCIPCHLIVNAFRAAMDKIFFVHKVRNFMFYSQFFLERLSRTLVHIFWGSISFVTHLLKLLCFTWIILLRIR